jgi:hypothetical protein
MYPRAKSFLRRPSLTTPKGREGGREKDTGGQAPLLVPGETPAARETPLRSIGRERSGGGFAR